MKLLLISVVVAFFALTTCFPSDELENEYGLYGGIIGDLINNTINKVLKNLTDPLEIKDMNLALNKTGTVSISDTSVSGVKGLVVNSINIDLMTGSLNMTIELTKTLSLKTKYAADLVLAALVPLYGAGPASIDLTGVELSVFGTLDIQSLSNITLTEIDVFISLDSANFDIQGLLNNPELSALINQALNDNLVNFVDKNNHLVSKILGPIIKAIINSILHKKK